MKFAFSVVLMVITLLVVVSAEAPEVENDVSDILERGRRTCAKENESCDVLKCCKGRPCECNMFKQQCKCGKRYLQVSFLWRNWE
uniref:U25-Sparatoxin-Hju1d_1 n=2 Tax=Heteropoda jugulans TaxID=1358901 RepID=A0A4Q8KD25_9ARAC